MDALEGFFELWCVGVVDDDGGYAGGGNVWLLRGVSVMGPAMGGR